MATTPPPIVFGVRAPDFRLPATDGKSYSLSDVLGKRGTLIVFICNHCPYVKAIIDRLVADAKVLAADGVATAAICSNDALAYPDDSFENMKRFAANHALPFPYLHDERQSVARAYEAVCTPDYFGYDGAGDLRYRGRLDEGRRDAPSVNARRELLEAMQAIAAGHEVPTPQIPSIGCSIKWKAAA